MAKKENKTEKIEFVKLENENDSITGKYVSFGKNKYGVFMSIDTKEGIKKVSLQSTVLNGLIKTNLDKFIDNENKINISITRGKKPVGKKYILYNVELDGTLLEGTQETITAKEIKDLF